MGETIRITGNPARREENHCFFRDFVFADGTAINRNTDLASLGRGSTEVAAATPVEDISALLFDDEPNISGYWTDAPTTGAAAGPAAPGAGGMGGMGIAPDGSLPPRLARIANIGLTPAGQQVQDAYERIYDDPALHCEISNIVDALGRDDTVNMIQQNGDTISFRYGYMDYLRTIHLNMDAHPESIEPTPGGHSIGKWEGGTLVVDTIGFTSSVFNAQVGIPNSEAFHVVERFSYNPETQELEREYVASDGDYWTETYSGRDSFGRSSIAYAPYNCETLSGLNNLRPGSPEYEAEVARLAAAADGGSGDAHSENHSAAMSKPATVSEGTTSDKKMPLMVAFVIIAIIAAGLLLSRRKKS